MEKEKKELIVSSDYYSSSYIVNKHYLVTIKRYAADNSLMIIDTTRADEEITTPLLAAIYRNLSRPDTDALLITNYSQKANKVTLLEIDTNTLLDRNELALKIDNQVFNITQKNKEYEEQKTQTQKNFHSNQSRGLQTVKENLKNNAHEVSESDNTERRQ